MRSAKEITIKHLKFVLNVFYYLSIKIFLLLWMRCAKEITTKHSKFVLNVYTAVTWERKLTWNLAFFGVFFFSFSEFSAELWLVHTIKDEYFTWNLINGVVNIIDMKKYGTMYIRIYKHLQPHFWSDGLQTIVTSLPLL